MAKNVLDVEVDLSGVDLSRVTDRLEAGAQGALGAAGQEIADEASRLAPKDTGRLSRSIAVKVLRGEAIIDPTAPYAAYVEFGTRNTPAQPFMRPAVRNAAAATLQHFRDIL